MYNVILLGRIYDVFCRKRIQLNKIFKVPITYYILCHFVVLASDMSSPVTGPAEPVYVEEKMYPLF